MSARAVCRVHWHARLSVRHAHLPSAVQAHNPAPEDALNGGGSKAPVVFNGLQLHLIARGWRAVLRHLLPLARVCECCCWCLWND